MNTPIGRGQTFLIPSPVGGTDLRSSASYNPRAGLKKSATTENITNTLLNSDSSDPPSTIIKSCQKRFREFGSDERKIISGFLSTPLLVIKTPGNTSRLARKDLPRSPLQKVTKKSNLCLFLNEPEGSSFLVKETSSIESIKSNETIVIEETFKESSGIIPSINSDGSNMIIPNTLISITSSTTSTLSNTTSAVSITQTNSNSHKEKEHESFQASVKARIREERERIESQAALQARKIQKLKAGPTTLPVKSTKPLTIPKEFQLGCDERAQLKKLQSKSQITKLPSVASNAKVAKPTIVQKFTPTIPKSPLFASKLRAAAKAKENFDIKENSGNNTKVKSSALDLRKKLEFKPTAPKSPKLSSIYRNRILNDHKSDKNNNKN